MFLCMGDNPYDFIANGNFEQLKGLYYRFQKEDEIIQLFNVLKRVLNDFGSIGDMVRHFYKKDVRNALWKARDYLFEESDDLKFFFPKSLPSNPMKRWNLYIRWMVRKDDIDVGLWNFINKKDLIIPLDTHLFKIGRCFNWTQCRTPSYKAAVEITNALKLFSPEDPLKYDFFLCHKVGIAAGCTGQRNENCRKTCIIYKR
mgnify:FL=1